MPETDFIITWELFGILISIVGGFGVLSFQVGRRSSDIDALAEATKANTAAISAHNDECKTERAQAADYRSKTNDRLADGTAKMAVLDERTQVMQSDIREIKEAVKGKQS